MTEVKTIDQDYRALTEGAAIQDRTSLGGLILKGRDRVDFLQRLTTNNIERIAHGGARITLLINPTARIEALFTVIAREEELWLLPWTPTAPDLSRRLSSQIFFMDKVTVEEMPRDSSWGRMRLMGPNAASLLEDLGWISIEEDTLREVDEGLFLLHQNSVDVPGFELFGDGVASVRDSLIGTGAQLLAESTAYQTRRVELGRPGPAAELSEDYTPLEVGLVWACAEDKGCYTGQEIIARQITYDKVTRHMVGLRSDVPLEVGGELFDGKRRVGRVTSVATSPRFGEIGLAVVHRSAAEAGRVLKREDSEVCVVELPFG